MRLHHLRPHQVEAALKARSLVYLPLGTVEWHCHHLPVGLDGLTAEALCLRAAAETGGLVWPTLWYGTGGDHGAFPWTVMPDGAEIEALLRFTLKRLAEMGVAQVILFSGHFAEEQLAMIDRMAGPHVTALAVNRAAIPGFPPDHAGAFETRLMQAIAPETVDLAQLGAAPDDRPRFDPASPLWGIVGADPRGPAVMEPQALFATLTQWLVAQVQAASEGLTQ